MKKNTIHLLVSYSLLIFLLCVFGGCSTSPEKLAKIVAESTVRIDVNFTEVDLLFDDDNAFFGTGVIIDKKDGYYIILTNLHVVGFWEIFNADALSGADIKDYSIKIKTHDSDTWRKVDKIIINSKLKDYALLYVNSNIGKYKTLNLSDCIPKIGNKVYAMGHPEGLDFTFTSGIVSASREKTSDLGAKYKMIQTDTAVNHGNSGGPLVDEKKRLIGINTSGIDKMRAEGLNFAISSQEIINGIDNNEFIEFPMIDDKIGPFVEKIKTQQS